MCPEAGPCENAKEPWGSIKGRDFLDHVCDYEPFKTDCSAQLSNITENKTSLHTVSENKQCFFFLWNNIRNFKKIKCKQTYKYIYILIFTNSTELHLDNLTVSQMVKKCSTTMELKGSSPCSQQPNTGLYPGHIKFYHPVSLR